jgi:eukaryotic-like serine/threonine-protein kinase
MECPYCQGENNLGAEVCFHCRAVLTAMTRGTLIASRFEVLSRLGRGGMGEVYRAHDQVLDEDVALKVLRGRTAFEWGDRFLSEIKLARKVSHSNVCRIHDYAEEGGLRWLSMELVEGENLKQIVGRRGPLPPAEAYDIAIQVTDGLRAIHEAGIVHRDLTAFNLMVDATGRVKVMDFGIAKTAASEATAVGSSSYLLGSPEYMSPEQARGRAAEERSDIYSLGIVIHELFTGVVPFRGGTPIATLLLHLEVAPKLDHPALTPALRALVSRCLAKEPEERFGSARELSAVLESAGRGILPRLSPSRRRRRRRRVAAGLGAFLVVGAAATALVTRSSSPGDPPNPAVPAFAAPKATTAAPVDLERSPLPPPAGATAQRPAPGTRLPSAPTPTTLDPTAVGSADAPAPQDPPPPLDPPSSPAPSPESLSSESISASAPYPEADGGLLVLVTPWGDVSIDGVPVGQTPLARIALKAGAHTVLLSHPEYQPLTRRVSIRPGETFRLLVDLAAEGVHR